MGLFLLSGGQMARIAPSFPLAHGVPRVDDRRVVSGIVYVIRHGLQWKDAPSRPFREALEAKGIEPCIPSSKSRKRPYPYDKTLYRQRHKIENLFAKLKDWRRVATRYDRCAHTFFSAICIAASVAFYLNQ